MATDNTQCNVSHPYEWLVDNGDLISSHRGFIRRINTDTPLDVPYPVPPTAIVATTVVPQNYNFWYFTKGTPNQSYFTLPSICWTPADWCTSFFSRGLIPTYSVL
jgi:hypothetical protein